MNQFSNEIVKAYTKMNANERKANRDFMAGRLCVRCRVLLSNAYSLLDQSVEAYHTN